jgi:hypothetical protein
MLHKTLKNSPLNSMFPIALYSNSRYAKISILQPYRWGLWEGDRWQLLKINMLELWLMKDKIL